jgi:hypothetical protein
MEKTTNMNIKKMLFSLLAALICVGSISAQTSLTQTTLAAAIQCGPSCANSGVGSGTSYQTTVNLTSATGVSVAVNGQPVTFIYVDQELMGVMTLLTGQTTVYSVLRAQQGTKLSAHVSGAMVLIETVSPQFGGYQGSGGFQQTDPPNGGACTATNTNATPWINIITGYQWLCSSITGTWVSGFNNPFAGDFSGQTATVAAATGAVLPTGALFVISGAGAISGFTIPVGCNATAVGACSFTVIAAAGSTWTWTAAGNIMTAGTGTAGHTFVFTWSASLQKFVPSSLS